MEIACQERVVGTEWVAGAKGNTGRGDFGRPSRVLDLLPFHLAGSTDQLIVMFNLLMISR